MNESIIFDNDIKALNEILQFIPKERINKRAITNNEFNKAISNHFFDNWPTK